VVIIKVVINCNSLIFKAHFSFVNSHLLGILSDHIPQCVAHVKEYYRVTSAEMEIHNMRLFQSLLFKMSKKLTKFLVNSNLNN
jgi:hypothetical protein